MFKKKNCFMCDEMFQPTGGCSKVCEKCRPEWVRQRAKQYHKQHYIQKGNYKWEMPKGKDSPSYKTGIGSFVRVAFNNYPNKCNRCMSEKNLCVHHKDRDRHNNEVSNLEIMCKSCHQKEHLVRDKKGRFVKATSLRDSPILTET